MHTTSTPYDHVYLGQFEIAMRASVLNYVIIKSTYVTRGTLNYEASNSLFIPDGTVSKSPHEAKI